MESMLRRIAALACTLMATCAARGESPIETYWRQFRDGNPAVSVWNVLDAREGVLTRVTINNADVDFLWDAMSASLVLYVDDELVADLVMSADADNRPVFHANWLSETVAAISGYIDLDEDSLLVIHWDEPGHESTRFAITSTGGVTAAAKCRCGGIGGTVYKTCANSDCDNPPVGCRRNGPVGSADTGFCEWKATTVVQPVEPIEIPVVTANAVAVP
ncbi:MAG: hypothetical protein KF902_03585 [Phycisphaeraceae bacterium]|nr:hypothetical protein [Phycisphaeraceae bacterium]MCW5768187.1 hypothetical protein [Phycisphaeraceae bacterium]